ncbi:MAG: hypothetical protein HY913_15435 [Desulfomonile tiedjei]|nr:hypothetical protein [Desulfomonile tiedjei]
MSSWESRILKLGDDTVFVECGPMRMFIEGSIHGEPQDDVCVRAANEAIVFLEEIAAHMDKMRGPARAIPEPPRHLLIHRMWSAVTAVGDPDLTPMAAVAGTIADATADFIARRGLTRVVVNNGGDVAIRLAESETLNVGIRPDLGAEEVTHRVLITPEMNIGGICTSGLGGRSFTRGVASAATVFAARAAIADAAATAVANATYISSPAVERCAAESIYPDTDLKGVEITASLGYLAEDEMLTALSQGMNRAEALVKVSLIAGACITVQGRMQCTEYIAGLVHRL